MVCIKGNTKWGICSQKCPHQRQQQPRPFKITPRMTYLKDVESKHEFKISNRKEIKIRAEIKYKLKPS